jgi:hypothetical protein
MDRSYLRVNSRLLSSLQTCIDEDEIGHKIADLQLTIDRIESVSGPSRRTLNLRNSVSRLQELLDFSRTQAEIRTLRYMQKSDYTEFPAQYHELRR